MNCVDAWFFSVSNLDILHVSILFFQTIFCSVQFSHSVVSNSLWPHEPQHARPPCPSPTPRFYLNSHPLSQWCHPTISSSVVPFSSQLQSFPASGSFYMSQFFTSGRQSTGVSASPSVLPMNIQDWCPLGWTGCCPRDSQESSPAPQYKNISSSVLSFLSSPTLPASSQYLPGHSSPTPSFTLCLMLPPWHDH